MKSDGSEPLRQSDLIDPDRASALMATLGRDVAVCAGDALPPFFHQIYFWNAQAPSALGRDGHPKVGGIIPDMGLPRRMWAGGRLQFHAPLRAGQQAERVTICESHLRKQGRSGPLGFVTLRHSFHQGGVECLTEWQDLVYREDARPDALRPKVPLAPADAETTQPQTFSTTQLFRYSALTFNGHRIHYDQDYARQVEGYEGLVVHGPLLAQYLMLKAEAELGPLACFQFRATAPVMVQDCVAFCRKGQDLWVQGAEGQLHMQAQAVPLSG